MSVDEWKRAMRRVQEENLTQKSTLIWTIDSARDHKKIGRLATHRRMKVPDLRKSGGSASEYGPSMHIDRMAGRPLFSNKRGG